MAEMNMSKDEQVGIHKGSLSVLAKEREEFLKLLNVVEQLMQAHIKALKDLGVDLEAEARKAQEAMQAKETFKKDDKDLANRLA
ncbi:hypothetical protein COV16_04970 [Candidatus Woesearchaeota archaeon CG10_big_fil_rev_8_21_14_0_10_34_8]|jgi:hypothetical protein|nr:MAG: hypothetical protein COV16_04970 [Candidatus Woesearchaeota archaeon CG10_big_fil_rev_8_21_14_0_10_34_8]